MTPQEFETAWERWSPGFQTALRYGGDLWTLDDVRNEILEGSAQFWANDDGAMVTNFFYSRRIKALWIWLLTGKRKAFDELMPMAEMWGIEEGCTMFMGQGREGLKRRAIPHGYRPWNTLTLFVKDPAQGLMQ